MIKCPHCGSTAQVEVCDHYNMNRSAMVASAISDYLQKLGIKVGER